MFNRLRADVPLHSRVKILTNRGDDIVGELIEVTDSSIRLINESGYPAMLSGQLIGGYWILKLPTVSEISDEPVRADVRESPECSEIIQPNILTDQKNDFVEPIFIPLSVPPKENEPVSGGVLKEPALESIEFEILESDRDFFINKTGSLAEDEPPGVEIGPVSNNYLEEPELKDIKSGIVEGNHVVLIDATGSLTGDDSPEVETEPISEILLEEPELTYTESGSVEGVPGILIDATGSSTGDDSPEVEGAPCSVQLMEQQDQQYHRQFSEKDSFRHLVTIRVGLPETTIGTPSEIKDALRVLTDKTNDGNQIPSVYLSHPKLPSCFEKLKQQSRKRLKKSRIKSTHSKEKQSITSSSSDQQDEKSQPEPPADTQLTNIGQVNDTTDLPEPDSLKVKPTIEDKEPESPDDSLILSSDLIKNENGIVPEQKGKCSDAPHKESVESKVEVPPAPLPDSLQVEVFTEISTQTSEEQTPEKFLSRFGKIIDLYHASETFPLLVAEIHATFPNKEPGIEQSPSVETEWKRSVKFFHEGKTLNDPKRLETAHIFFHRILEQYPASPTTVYNTGSIELYLDKYDEAQEHLERSYRQSPHPDALVNLAFAWVKLNNFGKAYATLARLLYDETDLPDASIWASFLYAARSVKDYGLLRSLVEKQSVLKEELTRPDRVTIMMKALVIALTELGERTRAGQLAELLEKETDQDQIGDIVQEVLLLIPMKKRIQKCKYQSYIHNILTRKIPEEMAASTTPLEEETALDGSMGFIYAKKKNWPYGFIQGNNGATYFFQLNYVTDPELLEKLISFEPGSRISVRFEVKPPLPSGPYERAVNVREWYTGDRISQPRPAISLFGSVPRSEGHAIQIITAYNNHTGNNSLPGDTIEAQLLHQVNNGQGTIETIKTLVDYYEKTGDYDAAIKLLGEKGSQIGDDHYIDMRLVMLKFSRNGWRAAMEHLELALIKSHSSDQRSDLLLTIGRLLIETEEFQKAEATLLRVLDENPESNDAIRLLLNCYEKSNRGDEGIELLSKRLAGGFNSTLQALIAKKTENTVAGHDSYQTVVQPVDGAEPLSPFCLFFLERAEFSNYKLEGSVELEGERRRYVGNRETAKRDIKGIEDKAKKTGTATIKSRAGLYLLAARVASDAKLGIEEIVKYLYRSFRSFGDEILEDESKHIESAMAFYYESLAAFDLLPRKGKADEPLTILVRFLRAIVEERYTKPIHGTPKVIDALDFIFGLDPTKCERIFDHISYLLLGSQLAAEEILKYLVAKPERLEDAKVYLHRRGVNGADAINSYERLNNLWRSNNITKNDAIKRLVHGLKELQSSTLYQGQLQQAAEMINQTAPALLFDLDKDHFESLKAILSALEHFHSEEGFEERERLLQLGMQDCGELRRDIGEVPTSFAIRNILPVIHRLNVWAKHTMDELYRTSIPKLTIRLRKDDEWFSPDYDGLIKIQIVFENAARCSPIESLELNVLEEDGALYHPLKEKYRLTKSLKGGDSEIIPVDTRIAEAALNERTFTLQVTAQYRSRSQDTIESVNASLPIRLYPVGEFDSLDNPYVYANSGPVEDPAMFFGRDELISNIITTIRTSPQANCYLIYGQKRSGKTSILYHIKCRLLDDPSTIVIDLDNIAVYFSSTVPVFDQILSEILVHISEEIRTRFVKTSLFDLVLDIPSRTELFADPTPFIRFNEIMERITAALRQDPALLGCQVVVLIDEFSYLYEQILRRNTPREFMKQWKALLQENFFKAIIAGQDVMPKFKMAFPNEFGTSQDERITYLHPEAARKLIEDPIRIGGPAGESRYVEKSVEYILNLTAGNPYYIQIVCSKLVELMNSTRSPYVSQYEVSRVRDELVKGTNRLCQDKFENLYNSGDTSSDAITDSDCLKVLKDIAINSRNGACPRQKITCKTKIDIETVLADLLSRDVIGKADGDLFTIRVGLFREWLLENSLSSDEEVESVDNPFSDYGIAVSGSGFIGRVYALGEINQRVVSNTLLGNLAIIGLPRIGKTSLAREAVSRFGAALIQKKRIPVEIDISIFSDVNEFFKVLLLESNVAIQRHHLLPPVIEPIILDSEGVTKDSVEFKLGIQKYFKEVRRAGIYLVFFLDEFDKIVDIFKGSQAWLQLLRDLASNPDYPVRLVTFSRREIAELERKIGDGGQCVSNLHGIFQTHFLGGFSNADLDEFFNKLSYAGTHLEDEQRHQMVDLCGPFPYYLNAASYQLVEGNTRGHCTDILDAIKRSQPELVENYQHICHLLEERKILKPFLTYLFNEEHSLRIHEFDLLVRYGLVKSEMDQYFCESKKFYQYLKTILPIILLKDRLVLAERLLRGVVTAHLQAKFGEDWVDGLEKDTSTGVEIMEQCRRYRYNVEQKHQNLSSNLIDYSTITNLFKLVRLYWNEIAPTFLFEPLGGALADNIIAWKTVTDDVIAARDAHAHVNEHLLSDEQTQQYANSCERLISWIPCGSDKNGTEWRRFRDTELYDNLSTPT